MCRYLRLQMNTYQHDGRSYFACRYASWDVQNAENVTHAWIWIDFVGECVFRKTRGQTNHLLEIGWTEADMRTLARTFWDRMTYTHPQSKTPSTPLVALHTEFSDQSFAGSRPPNDYARFLGLYLVLAHWEEKIFRTSLCMMTFHRNSDGYQMTEALHALWEQQKWYDSRVNSGTRNG